MPNVDVNTHMAEGNCVPGTPEEIIPSSMNMHDPGKCDRNTCFLCCMRFPTVEMCKKHQHHVHMRWVSRTSVDYSKVVSGFSKSDNEGEIGQAIQDIQLYNVLEMSLNQNDPAFLISVLEQQSQVIGQQIFAQGTTETAEGEQAVTISIKETLPDTDFDLNKATKTFKAMGFSDITGDKNDDGGLVFNREVEKKQSKVSKRRSMFYVSLDDLPDANERFEVGFLPKVGNFCHLCNMIIKKYRPYYLHMHNFHQLEKRFQCIIIACGKTFSEEQAFQDHAFRVHNQKSTHNCSLCDNMFRDDEELQYHLTISDHANKFTQFQLKKKVKRPALEDCTLEIIDDYNTMILPNCVQLVDSELPLSVADNCDKLSGMFLFRQIFSSYDNTLQCLFCRNKYSVRFHADLEKHYRVIHGLAVHTNNAEFNENIVFVCVASNVNEETTLISSCCICDTILKTMSEIRDHHLNSHNKTVRLVPQSDMTGIRSFFYCGICGHPSADFTDHHQHMKVMHRMQTYVCRYCTYCTSRPSRLITHVKQRHLQCSVCSIYVHGKDRLTKHMFSHAVQTGPKTWSCAKCIYPYGDPQELMNHIPTCPKLQTNSEAKSNEASDNTISVFYKCNHCPLTFSSEEEIKKHMAEGNHCPGTPEEIIPSSMNMHDTGNCDPANFDRNTCFLCCMRFPTIEMCRKHQYHVHMRWVSKTSMDYSKVVSGFPKSDESEIGQAIQDIQFYNVLEMSLNQNDPAFLISVLEQQSQVIGQQIFAQGTTETAEGEQAVTISIKENLPDTDFDLNKATKTFEAMGFSDITGDKNDDGGLVFNREVSKEYQRLGKFDVSLDDLPDAKELSEIGFPPKVGNFCYLCDANIENYRLYYLHMCNLHQLEKRFQCIITACGKTFSEVQAFQDHAFRVHNQKSEHYCSMCDNVFSDDEALQDHLLISDHANKYMQVQKRIIKENSPPPLDYDDTKEAGESGSQSQEIGRRAPGK